MSRLGLSACLLVFAAVARADVSAGSSTHVAAESARCETRPLRFAPRAEARYIVSTWDGAGVDARDPKGAYRSTLVFSPRAPDGWTAVETDLRRPFVPPEKSGFA